MQREVLRLSIHVYSQLGQTQRLHQQLLPTTGRPLTTAFDLSHSPTGWHRQALAYTLHSAAARGRIGPRRAVEGRRDPDQGGRGVRVRTNPNSAPAPALRVTPPSRTKPTAAVRGHVMHAVCDGEVFGFRRGPLPCPKRPTHARVGPHRHALLTVTPNRSRCSLSVLNYKSF
ncbi:uncharacterized protein LOC120667635 [Panicum virgatum]|uniref:Uncharacterized protein n=1 Tax=Panicum virgatum TaxID=38727 RepID=A0A8T0U0M4_PANVG|nr:uncharacterized protein LOC120667635 [Panicum virgatum]KAG2618042.1 hypothetical protein PVAP13_3NG258148 [Panicum virgatum]